MPDGALEVAKNVVMTKDAILSKRRGFYEYFDPDQDTLNRLATFSNTLMAIFTNGISSFADTGTNPNETGSRTELSGETVSITGGRVSRFAESNKNFYFTTDNGVFKIESVSSSIFRSGTPPALYLRGDFLAANGPISGGSSLLDGSQVAYRVVFGRRDSNSNLLLGAPSDILGLSNAKVVGVAWTRSTNVVTVTVGVGHNLIAGMTVVISGSTGATPVGAGSFTITAVTSTTYDFAETAADSSGDLDYSVTRQARIEFGIPSEIDSVTDDPFVQVYRSSQTNDVDTTPSSDFKLVTERLLTVDEISLGFGTYDDSIDNILLGSELYTNPNSREGELQSNSRPPLCTDMALYKEHVFYSNTTSRHILSLDIIDSTAMVDGDYVEIQTVGDVIRRYVARTGAGNQLLTAESVAGTTTITVTYTAHGFSTGDTVVISNVTGTITPAEYTLTGVTANTFTFTAGASETATAVSFQGLGSLLSGTLYPMFTLDIASLSLAVRLRNTAQGLVKAIDRDSSSVIYAQYVSGIVGVPGKMRFQAKGFGGAIQVRAITSTAGAGFSPALTTTFASTESTNDEQPNALFIGKISEPEAVPLVNFLLVGARNQAIVRIAALRDSLIVIKEDGVFRITGDSVGGFVATILDSTVVCIAPSSVAVINNQVVMLSNQGFCLITENSVQIISRVIEDVIQPIVGLPDIATATAGVAHETERLYLCSTLEPSGSGNPTVTYCYNILNNSWTTWNEVFNQAAIGANDKLHTVTYGNKINRQRKNQTKLDFAGQNYEVSVTAVDTSTNSVTLTSASATPQEGWIIVYNGVINRIISAVLISESSYAVTFERASTIEVTGAGWGEEPWGEFPWGSLSPVMYASHETQIKLAPFHGGMVGRFKQFAQFQIHQRGGALSGLEISYSGANSSSSGAVDWSNAGISSDVGWGLGYWGLFPWGDEEGISIVTGTQAGSIARVYVPIEQQRSTFIQPILTHSRAAEEMNLQAMSFSVRAFQERVSR